MKELAEKKALDDDMKKKLNAALDEFKELFVAEEK